MAQKQSSNFGDQQQQFEQRRAVKDGETELQQGRQENGGSVEPGSDPIGTITAVVDPESAQQMEQIGGVQQQLLSSTITEIASTTEAVLAETTQQLQQQPEFPLIEVPLEKNTDVLPAQSQLTSAGTELEKSPAEVEGATGIEMTTTGINGDGEEEAARAETQKVGQNIGQLVRGGRG